MKSILYFTLFLYFTAFASASNEVAKKAPTKIDYSSFLQTTIAIKSSDYPSQSLIYRWLKHFEKLPHKQSPRSFKKNLKKFITRLYFPTEMNKVEDQNQNINVLKLLLARLKKANKHLGNSKIAEGIQELYHRIDLAKLDQQLVPQQQGEVEAKGESEEPYTQGKRGNFNHKFIPTESQHALNKLVGKIFHIVERDGVLTVNDKGSAIMIAISPTGYPVMK